MAPHGANGKILSPTDFFSMQGANEVTEYIFMSGQLILVSIHAESPNQVV